MYVFLIIAGLWVCVMRIYLISIIEAIWESIRKRSCCFSSSSPPPPYRKQPTTIKSMPASPDTPIKSIQVIPNTCRLHHPRHRPKKKIDPLCLLPLSKRPLQLATPRLVQRSSRMLATPRMLPLEWAVHLRARKINIHHEWQLLE